MCNRFCLLLCAENFLALVGIHWNETVAKVGMGKIPFINVGHCGTVSPHSWQKNNRMDCLYWKYYECGL